MYLYITFAVLAVICPSTYAVSTPGYLVTAPSRFIGNRAATVCIDLYNVPNATVINVLLSVRSTGRILDQALALFHPGESVICVQLTAKTALMLPADSGSLNLAVMGRPIYDIRNGFRFTDVTTVAMLSRYVNTEITFVQTDKPLYKPGDLVRIRIVTLDVRLRPTNDMIRFVYIRTPGGIRVEQWNNMTVTKGLIQLEFQLHREPELGNYQVVMYRNGRSTTERFEVKEYVLPKYEISIEPPKYVTLRTERVIAKVCARYTFGQPVLGVAVTSVCAYEQRSNSRKYCSAVSGQLVDGCYTINTTRAAVSYNRFYHYRYQVRLDIEAYVEEKGTGDLLNATSKTLYFQRYDVKLNFDGPNIIKAGLPYIGKCIAKRPDGSPAIGELIDILAGNSWDPTYRKSYIADVNGEVRFSLPPDFGAPSSIRLQAVPTKYFTFFSHCCPQMAYLSLKPWYSPTASYLQIVPNTETFTCGSHATFDIQYTTSIALNTQLRYQVVGQTDVAVHGSVAVSLNLNTTITERSILDTWDITQNGSLGLPTSSPTPPQVQATHKGILSITVPVTAAMSTSAKLIVYYVRPDGEVVADSTTFNVEKCTDNAARMRFSQSQARPGERVDLLFSASANSLCSYGVVDKSVFLEGGNNQLSLSQALSKIQHLVLNRYTRRSGSTTGHCGSTPRSVYQRYYWTTPYGSASEGFRDAGLTTMSNLAYSPFCQINSYSTGVHSSVINTPASFGFVATAAPAAAPTQPAPAASPATVAPVAPAVPASPTAPATAGPSVSIRTYFPESWLWDVVNINGTGKATVSSTVPDTITEWVGNAVCLDELDGLGVSAPASLIAFQPFFVSMNLPYSVIRTEKVPIAVTVSNYLSQCLAVMLRLNASPEYQILRASSAVVCTCDQTVKSKTFTIIARDIGDVHISVTAEIVNDTRACPAGSQMTTTLLGTSDTVIRPVIVEPEGTPREYTISDFVCMTNPNSSTAVAGLGSSDVTYTLPLPGPTVLISGSERVLLTLVGDVMGPALNNIGNLLRMPYGCGEQIMVAFAPNIFVMKYLNAINRNDPELTAKAISYMKGGYQRELTFAHSDQSYSTFGSSNFGASGSMWLTAFVVKCFGLAQPYIYIDSTIQSRSINFFLNNQDSGGCFPQIGMVHSKYMQGGIGATSRGTNNAALTAYVAIAMLESGVEASNPSIGRAFQCIDQQTYSDGYTTSLVAYAYSLYNRTDDRVYRRLLTMAVTVSNGAQAMWKANQNEVVQNRGRWWYYRPHSADTETTAYALLTLLRMSSTTSDKITEGLPIVRWLSTQRNSWGGFGSTQDTVIGLQALAEYATLVYATGGTATVTVTESITNLPIASFRIHDGNRLVEMTERVPRVTNLRVRATGVGCFLIQTNVRYNINQQDNILQAFLTTATVIRKQGSTTACKSRQLQLCTQYSGEGNSSNMAIIEVKMVSGWAADQTVLKGLRTNPAVRLRRFEVDPNGAVQLYFDELNRSQKCFTMDINQKFDVKDVKPAIVTTYDYYKTELRQEVQYTIDGCVQVANARSLTPVVPI